MTIGMTVVGAITGSHIIEDLGIVVPHRVAVSLTPEQMLRSKDLYRGLQQGYLFKLHDAPNIKPATVPEVTRSVTLEHENARLQDALDSMVGRNAVLQQELTVIHLKLDTILGRLDTPHQKLDSIIATLEKLQQPQYVAKLESPLRAQSSEGAVASEIPIFLPETLKLEDVEASIEVEQVSTSGANVKGAGDRLRQIRRGGG